MIAGTILYVLNDAGLSRVEATPDVSLGGRTECFTDMNPGADRFASAE